MAGRPITPPALVLIGKVWHVRFNDGTRQRVETLRTSDLGEAIQRFAQWLLGSAGSEGTGKEHAPFREIAEYYRRTVLWPNGLDGEPGVVSARGLDTVLNSLIAGLGNETCATLRRKSVAMSYRDKRMSGVIQHIHPSGHVFVCGNPNSVRRELGVAQTACAHWIQEHELAISAPVIWKPERRATRRRAFTPAQQKQLLDAARKVDRAGRVNRLYRFARIALVAGARATCIEALEYGFNVDLAKGRIDFRTAEYRERERRGLKIKKIQVANFTIPDDLLAEMREWQEMAISKYVLDRTTQLYKRFRSLCERLGMPWGTRHLTRHTVMTELLDSGVSPATLPHSHGISERMAATTYYHPTAETIASVQTLKRTPKLRVVA